MNPFEACPSYTTVTVYPGKLHGTVIPPASKSMAHRCLIAAFLAGGENRIHNLGTSQDVLVTLQCLDALKNCNDSLPLLDCGESGSTLRFFIPIALVLCGGARFTGRGRLMERPQDPYFSIFQEKGIHYELRDHVLTIQGNLTPGEYKLAGNVSSQFVTGLLYALSLLPGDSFLHLTTPLESRAYVDMTIDVLARFGVQIREEMHGFFIPGSQRYKPQDLIVEADWSHAGFWYAAKALGSEISVEGLNFQSFQGDKMILQAFQQLTQPGDVVLDVSQCPDLVPPLAAMAAVRHGTTCLVNAARLRIKESDRLNSVTTVLNAMGAQVEEYPDSLCITGKEALCGGVTVDCFNDHRIAMMAGIAATCCNAPVILCGADCVNKSYPEFWNHYCSLGGKIEIFA